MKTVLVTGAAGFIGSHVAEALLARGDAVVAMDNVNDYYNVQFKRRNLAILGSYPQFSFLETDICDTTGVQWAFADHKITHVAHLAARAGVRPSIQHPQLYQETNVGGTLNLLQTASAVGVDNFVLTSSSSVYGDSRQVPFVEDDAATDRPISPYAATKKAAELLGYTYHRLHGLNVNVIRPFTVYGPRGRPDMAPWLFVEAALHDEPITKFGDGSTARDYTYIDDFVRGFVAAIDRPLGYEIINLGDSRPVSLNEAIGAISDIHGLPLKITQHAMQPGDVHVTHADISKAQRLLGYSVRTPYRDGMRRFYEWFKTTR
jgi:UDP-glucuronate 4-epimerase